jgi:hypothetical protein
VCVALIVCARACRAAAWQACTTSTRLNSSLVKRSAMSVERCEHVLSLTAAARSRYVIALSWSSSSSSLLLLLWLLCLAACDEALLALQERMVLQQGVSSRRLEGSQGSL